MRDVPRLAALVAATQQDDEGLTLLDEIQPVSRPMVDAGFADSLANRLDITHETALEAVDACQDALPRLGVSEVGEPSSELVGLANLGHVCIIGYTNTGVKYDTHASNT